MGDRAGKSRAKKNDDISHGINLLALLRKLADAAWPEGWEDSGPWMDNLLSAVKKLVSERGELRGRLNASEEVLEAHARQNPQRITLASLEVLRDQIVAAIPDDSESLIKIRATVGHFVDAVLKCEVERDELQKTVATREQMLGTMRAQGAAPREEKG